MCPSSGFLLKKNVGQAVFAALILFLLSAPAMAADTSATTSTEINCPDVQQKMIEAQQKRQEERALRYLNQFRSHSVNSLKDNKCLVGYNTLFQQIAELRAAFASLGSGGALVSKAVTFIMSEVIAPLVNKVVNQACEYAASTVNAALSKVCLPIPNFTMPFIDLNLQNPSMSSCAGISLSDYIGVSTVNTTILPAGPRFNLRNFARGFVPPRSGAFSPFVLKKDSTGQSRWVAVDSQ